MLFQLKKKNKNLLRRSTQLYIIRNMVVYISAYNGFEVVRRLGSEPGMVRWDHGSDPGGSRAAQITATKLGILPNVTVLYTLK